jgi:hypothetical protein
MSFKLYSEILQEFDLAPTRKDKITVLQNNDSPRFRQFFVFTFNQDIQYDVTIPSYTPSLNPAGLNDLYIDSQLSKVYRFIKDHPQRAPGFGGIQQERILLLILESLHKDEAELFCRMLQKNLSIKYLTPHLIKEAYPGIAL